MITITGYSVNCAAFRQHYKSTPSVSLLLLLHSDPNRSVGSLIQFYRTTSWEWVSKKPNIIHMNDHLIMGLVYTQNMQRNFTDLYTWFQLNDRNGSRSVSLFPCSFVVMQMVNSFTSSRVLQMKAHNNGSFKDFLFFYCYYYTPSLSYSSIQFAR